MAARSVGITNLSFIFSGGAAQNLAVTVSDSTVRDSRVTPGAVSFDRKEEARADIELTLTLNGNELTGISHGGTALAAGDDYTVSENRLVLKRSYLTNVPAGTSELEFSFSAGERQSVALVVRDTSLGGVITLNDDDPSIAYVGGWNRSHSRGLGDYMDDVHFAETDNSDYFEYTFTGTGIELITELDPSQGDMDIYVDGEFRQRIGTANLGRLVQQPVYSITGLEYGEHKLSAVKRSGWFMLLDQLRVLLPDLIDTTESSFDKAAGEQADVTVAATLPGVAVTGVKNGTTALHAEADYTLSGDRVTIGGPYLAARPEGRLELTFSFRGDRHNDVHFGTANGDYAEYAFAGTGVELIMPKGPSQGDVAIYVDDVYKETVSAYHPSRLTQQVVYAVSGLTDGVHKIRAVKESGDEILLDGLRFSIAAPAATNPPTSSPTPDPTPTPTVPTGPSPTPTVDPTSSPTPDPTPSPNATDDPDGERRIIAEPYIQGYGDGSFRPDNVMTRAEIAAILSRIARLDAGETDKACSDVASGHWASEAISTVTRMGLMGGYEDGTFRADQAVTRAEIVKLIVLVTEDADRQGAGFPDTSGHWAEVFIRQAREAGIVNGYPDGSFRPNQALTRAEAVRMLNKAMGRGPADGSAGLPWHDVPATHWAYGDIVAASAE